MGARVQAAGHDAPALIRGPCNKALVAELYSLWDKGRSPGGAEYEYVPAPRIWGKEDRQYLMNQQNSRTLRARFAKAFDRLVDLAYAPVELVVVGRPRAAEADWETWTRQCATRRILSRLTGRLGRRSAPPRPTGRLGRGRGRGRLGVLGAAARHPLHSVAGTTKASPAATFGRGRRLGRGSAPPRATGRLGRGRGSRGVPRFRASAAARSELKTVRGAVERDACGRRAGPALSANLPVVVC